MTEDAQVVNPTASGLFGVALDLDGGAMIVGKSDGAGILRLVAGNWVAEADLPSTLTITDDYPPLHFVSISGNVAVVGGLAEARVYRFDGANWNADGVLTGAGSQFGRAVAVAGDVIIVGSPDADVVGPPFVSNAGAAFLYRHDGAQWNLEATLTASGATSGDGFGFSVAIDGNVAVVGAPFGDGAAYPYRYDGFEWHDEGVISSLLGPGVDFGVGLGVSNDYIVVGMPYSSRASSLDGGAISSRYDGTTWTWDDWLYDPSGDQFQFSGTFVSVDGGEVVLGGNGWGKYFRTTGEFCEFGACFAPTQLLPSSPPALFRGAVAIDGNLALVGSVSENTVYVYILNDCNNNDIPDDIDISSGTSEDCDANGTPDECQSDTNMDGIIDACDCNDNGEFDADDIANGTSQDCDANGAPDECDPDTNMDGVIDACDCNDNGEFDSIDIAMGFSPDHNQNAVPDECDTPVVGTAVWSNALGGTFASHLNWNPDTPGPANPALFDLNGPYTVTFNTNSTIEQLLIDAGQVDYQMAGYALTVDSITNPGIVIDGAAGSGTTLSASNGTIEANSARIASTPGSEGMLLLDNGATLALTENMCVGCAGDGVLVIDNASLAIARDIVIGDQVGSSGSVRLTGIGSALQAPFFIVVDNGSLLVEAGSTVEVGFPMFGGIFLFESALLKGDSSVLGSVVNFGTIMPTDWHSTLQLNGDYFQVGNVSGLGDAAGLLTVHVGGDPGPPSAGRLDVSGEADLAGGLVVQYEPLEFMPSDPNTLQNIELLTAGSITGSFDVGLFPGLGIDTDRFLTFSIDPGSLRSDGTRALASVFLQVNSLGGVDVEFDPSASANSGQAGVPTDAALADIDRDGDQDLIVALPKSADPLGTGSVVILYNAGTIGGVWQGFSGSAQVPVGVNPSGVAVGPINADEWPDIVVSNRGTPGDPAPDTVSVLISNSGAFDTTVVPVVVGDGPSDVAIADLDRDGAADIATANADGHSVTVVWNSGTGSGPAWDGPEQIDPIDLPDDGECPLSIRPGDFDAGIAFLATANSGNDTIGLVGFDGRSATVLPSIAADAGTTDLIVQDLDLDGRDDISAVNRVGNTVTIVLNKSSALSLSFGPPVDLPVGAGASQPQSISAGDFDTDGDSDLAIVVESDTAGARVVKILRNDLSGPGGQLVFATLPDQDPGTDPLLVRTADLNSDSRDDVVTVSEFTGSPLLAGTESAFDEAGWRSAGTRRSIARGARARGVGAPDIVLIPAVPPCVGDLDGDGHTDVFDFGIFASNFGATGLPPNTGGDLDGDGDVDVFDFGIFAANFGCVP